MENQITVSTDRWERRKVNSNTDTRIWHLLTKQFNLIQSILFGWKCQLWAAYLCVIISGSPLFEENWILYHCTIPAADRVINHSLFLSKLHTHNFRNWIYIDFVSTYTTNTDTLSIKVLLLHPLLFNHVDPLIQWISQPSIHYLCNLNATRQSQFILASIIDKL